MIDQQKLFEMMMKQQEQQNKIIMNAIWSRYGGPNIEAIKLTHDLGGHNNVSETRTDDRSTAATTEKPVPHQEWLD